MLSVLHYSGNLALTWDESFIRLPHFSNHMPLGFFLVQVFVSFWHHVVVGAIRILFGASFLPRFSNHMPLGLFLVQVFVSFWHHVVVGALRILFGASFFRIFRNICR